MVHIIVNYGHEELIHSKSGVRKKLQNYVIKNVIYISQLITFLFQIVSVANSGWKNPKEYWTVVADPFI